MIRLGVNIDHVATVRQARKETFPSPVAAAHAALLGGADAITMHLREDRRHIQDHDIRQVHEALHCPINFEMACTDEMAELALSVRPKEVLIVPERREELTTEGGLDVRANEAAIAATIERLREGHIPVSLFVDPDEEALLAANAVGATTVELHTGRYAGARSEGERIKHYLDIQRAARTAKELGLRVHAGHGLDYGNVERIAAIPEIEELNIGFAIVARALFVGLTEAVRQMKQAMREARAGVEG